MVYGIFAQNDDGVYWQPVIEKQGLYCPKNFPGHSIEH